MAPKTSDKKKGTKIPTEGQRPGALASSSSAAAGDEDGVCGESKGWFENLSPEEQQAELSRQAQRDEAGEAEQKKQAIKMARREEERKSREKEEREAARKAMEEKKYMEQIRQRAFQEGVLESEDGYDGCWYVEIEEGTWKKVLDTYWCRHCEAPLNYSVLESHLTGERHRKGLAHAGLSAAAAPISSGASASASVPLPPTGFQLAVVHTVVEPWQRQDAQGNILCTPCGRLCDGVHEYTKDHNRKVEFYLWDLTAAEQVYPEPPQLWLAWVEEASFGRGRFLKCLMCDKWTQDWGGDLNTEAYCGNHGLASESNQKDHARRLANYSEYSMSVEREKAKWHPPSQGDRQAPAPPTYAAAPPPVPLPPLPDGWRSVWSHDHNKHYYYHAERRSSQWELPGVMQVAAFALSDGEAVEC